MKLFFELAISAFQVVVLHSFFVKNLDGIRLRRKYVHYGILGAVFATLTLAPSFIFSLLKLEDAVFTSNFNVSLTLTSIVSLVFILYLGNFVKKAIFLILYLFINIAAEVLTASMISMIAGVQIDIFSIDATYYTAKAVTLIFAFVLLTLISAFKMRKTRIKPIYGLLLIVVPVISMAGVFFLFTMVDQFTLLYPFIICALLYFNIFVFYMFDKMLDRLELTEKNRLLDMEIAYQASRYKDLENSLQMEKTKVHDVKHHMRYIIEHAEKSKEITDYAEKILGKTLMITLQVDSGNSVVNAFIRNLFAESEKYSIRAKHRIEHIGQDLFIEKDDLCVLLGNILDNAIEACRAIPDTLKIDRFIDIAILKKDKSLVVHVTNSCCSDRINKNDGVFKTTKKDKENHGIGLYSIEQIVEKYNGYSIVNSESNTFSITCVLNHSYK